MRSLFAYRCAALREPAGSSRRYGGDEPRRSAGRVGATLTEVLMAILIMGVGVVSVFTLFPISVLRTIQATNQTNAKILKENVEEQLSQSPVLLSAFQAISPDNPLTGVTFDDEWRAGKAYLANRMITPTVKPGSATRTLALLFNGGGGGTSGLVEPVWNPAGSSTTDGTVTWTRPGVVTSANPVLGDISLNRYVVDPLGWNLSGADGLPDIQDFFGNQTDRTGANNPTPRGVLRISGGQNTVLAAADVCTHPDSWQQVTQATPTAVGADSVTFPATSDLNGIFPAGTVLVAPRVVLTSGDGKQTVVRTLTGIAGQTASWSASEPLPTRFDATDVGQARIEVFNRRYTWFMTVRNVGLRPEIKCVVTFNRSFNSAEEHVYAANFGNPDLDLNQVNGVDSADGLTGTNQVMLAWQFTNAAGFDPEVTGTDNINEPEPLLKPGNWLFDARDASWYRIQSVDNSDLNATPRWAVLTLDRSVRIVTPDDNAGPPSAPTPIGRAILMPGIVDVFDL